MNKEKELAKMYFINELSKLPPIDPDKLSSLFTYMQNLDVLLDDIYNTAFN